MRHFQLTEYPTALAEFGRSIENCLFPVYLGDIRDRDPEGIERNGTAFLFQSGDDPLLVTAGHVYRDAAKFEESSSSGKTGIANCRMSFCRRLISWNQALDIAVIRVSAQEANELGTTFVPQGRLVWPSPPPEEGDLAVLAGFPGREREVEACNRVSMGIYTAYLKVASVGPRQIGFVINPTELDDFLGTGKPIENYPLGGLSGAPVLLLEQGALLTWGLFGVVTDQHDFFDQDVVLAARADHIRASGEVHDPSA